MPDSFFEMPENTVLTLLPGEPVPLFRTIRGSKKEIEQILNTKNDCIFCDYIEVLK